MLPLLWVACAVVIVTAAVRSRRDRTWLLIGRLAVATLYIGAGAGVNAFFVLRGDDYAEFAEGSYLPFVRDTWSSLVVPNHHLFIWMLVGFELGVGVLALAGGRRTLVGYAAAVAFHVGLLFFGWGFYLWSVPMIAALVSLWHSERRVLGEGVRTRGRRIPVPAG